MHSQTQVLSIINISEICEVARSTASYWITKKGLPAHRSGNKFLVSIEDLIIFLESLGRPVPSILVENLGRSFSYPFKSHQSCWNYWKKDAHGENCENCSVFKCQINECFTLKADKKECPSLCSQCQYFFEYYSQYTTFIHQMSMPVAIFKDLYIWSGNRAWADLCGVDIDKLIGIGVEELFHPESIRTIINFNKEIQRGNSTGILKSPVWFENKEVRKIDAKLLSMTALKQPEGACFALAENVT
jgi:hypothetical protein